jgi:uncharacterized membrane protein
VRAGHCGIVRRVKAEPAAATPSSPSASLMPPGRPSGRLDRLDALRGVAIVWMAAFHFCFDLNYFKLMPKQNFYTDPFWTWQRACIVTLFLFCAGLSQAAAHEADVPWPRFWRRWAQIAGCAVLVSIGSWLMFPNSWSSCGVRHGIALMLIVARLSAPFGGRLLWPLGGVALALPWFVRSPFFETRWTNWVGLVTRKPVTEDWVPLLPWVGVMLWGLATGLWLLRRRRHWLAGRPPRAAAPLAARGRWSLPIYKRHPPVFIGLLSLWIWARR